MTQTQAAILTVAVAVVALNVAIAGVLLGKLVDALRRIAVALEERDSREKRD